MRRGAIAGVLVLSAMSASWWLSGCCGAPAAPVSLTRTYTLVDEDGRKAGTVVFTPLGSGEIRDSDSTVIGIVTPPPGKVVAPPPEPEKKQGALQAHGFRLTSSTDRA